MMPPLWRNRVKRVIAAARSMRYGDRTLQIGDVRLSVDGADPGGRQYDGRGSYEQTVDPLVGEIGARLAPRLVIDVGANYGFTAIVFARNLPGVDLILVEPSPSLQPYLRRNLRDNGVQRATIIQAACGAAAAQEARFALNPSGSQDNRMRGEPGWASITVPTTTLSALLRHHGGQGPVFVKIDTQGSEDAVFRGGAELFEQRDDWLVKTEFAPAWLLSQGTAPEDFLRRLVGAHRVVEAPARTRWRGDGLARLLAEPLATEHVDGFTAYVRSLDRAGRGWCDLLVAPRASALV